MTVLCLAHSIPPFALSQETTLSHKLTKSLATNATAQALLELGWKYFDKDSTRQCIHLVDSVLSMNVTDTLRVQALKLKGKIWLSKSNYDQANLLYNEALSIALKQNIAEELGQIYFSLGASYCFKADYNKSLESYFRSLQIYEGLDDRVGECGTLNGMGLLYYKIRDNEKAISYYHRAMSLADKLNLKSFRTVILQNLALCFIELDRLNEGLSLIDTILSHADTQREKEIVIGAYFAKGMAYLKMNRFEDSKNLFLKSNVIAIQEENYRFQAENYCYLSKVYLAKNEFNNANAALEASMAICEKYDYQEILYECYKQGAKLYTAANDISRLATFQEKMINQKKRIYNSELMIRLAKVEASLMERENQKSIDHQRFLLSLQSQILDTKNAVQSLLILCCLLFIVFTILQYQSFRQKKIIQSYLEKSVHERVKEIKSKDLKIDFKNDRKRQVSIRFLRELQTIRGQVPDRIPGISCEVKKMIDETLQELDNVIAILQRKLHAKFENKSTDRNQNRS